MELRKGLLVLPLFLVVALLSPLISAEECGVKCARWWKDYLSSEDGNLWFDPWNRFMQAKLDVLAAVAEQRGEDETGSFRVLMVGDSTMSHQFGAICAFVGERDGRRFNPEETQSQSPGCCMDTLPQEEGGGRGLCFQYDYFRFLDPKRPARTSVDVYYFGSGLHLLHMFPEWPEFRPMEPLRVQSWLNYESLLEGVVEGARAANGPNAMVVFNTNHAVADELFEGEYKAIHEAYRVGEGNATIRAECEGDNNAQVRAGASGDPHDFKSPDWHAYPEIAEYMIYPEGQGLFTVDTYCEEAILDRRGSLQMSRSGKRRWRSLAHEAVQGDPALPASAIHEARASGFTSEHARVGITLGPIVAGPIDRSGRPGAGVGGFDAGANVARKWLLPVFLPDPTCKNALPPLPRARQPARVAKPSPISVETSPKSVNYCPNTSRPAPRLLLGPLPFHAPGPAVWAWAGMTEAPHLLPTATLAPLSPLVFVSRPRVRRGPGSRDAFACTAECGNLRLLAANIPTEAHRGAGQKREHSKSCRRHGAPGTNRTYPRRSTEQTYAPCQNPSHPKSVRDNRQASSSGHVSAGRADGGLGKDS